MIQGVVTVLVEFATDWLLPVMIVAFMFGMAVRGLIYYTVKREDWFAKEFEKRLHKYVDTHHEHLSKSFYVSVKKLLEITFYELFEVRAILKRRKPDFIMAWADRLFLIQQGVACLVKDTLKQIRYLNHGDIQPKFIEICKTVFQNNPAFSRIFGLRGLPSSMFNDVLNILPGLFIIGGIFGTFLGIMAALPQLGNMNLDNVEQTQAVMSEFLSKISYSMSTSIFGIMLSVAMTIFNTIFSPEKLFIEIVERYENAMDLLWNRSSDNVIPADLEDFDETKDPIEALASEALISELKKSKWESYRVGFSKAHSNDDYDDQQVANDLKHDMLGKGKLVDTAKSDTEEKIEKEKDVA